MFLTGVVTGWDVFLRHASSRVVVSFVASSSFTPRIYWLKFYSALGDFARAQAFDAVYMRVANNPVGQEINRETTCGIFVTG